MKKKLLIGLVIGFFLFGTVGVASATMVISDVGITSNSVTFTIDGTISGYTLPYQYETFSLEYFGDIFLTDGGYAPNTWSTSIFDSMSFFDKGNTGTFSIAGSSSAFDCSWSDYDTSLVNAISTNRTITLSTTKNYFDINGTGRIGFYLGIPLSSHTELAMIDINGQPVPEPATLILLGGGLAGLAFYRRKRK